MPQVTEMDILNQCVPYLEMLKDPQRQAIIMNLACKKELSVSELVDLSDLSMPAVSHHLKLLTQSGLVQSKKVGTRRFYRLSLDEAVTALEGLLVILKSLQEE